MPSAEETTYLIEVMQDLNITSTDSFTSHDVDVLVSRIKKDLRLSGFKRQSHRSSSRLGILRQKRLASPYTLPTRSWSAEQEGPSTCELCSARTSTPAEEVRIPHHQRFHNYRNRTRYSYYRKPGSLDLDDSYERFQALLSSGALIKEAVKRLQTLSEDDELVDDEESNNSSSNNSSKRRTTSTSASSVTLDSMDE